MENFRVFCRSLFYQISERIMKGGRYLVEVRFIGHEKRIIEGEREIDKLNVVLEGIRVADIYPNTRGYGYSDMEDGVNVGKN